MVTKVTTVKTQDCPDANGRQPLADEVMWTLKFPLEDGTYLFVQVGKTALNALREMFAQHDTDYPDEG